MRFLSSLPLVITSLSIVISLPSGSQAGTGPGKNQTAYHCPLPKVPKNLRTIQLEAFIYDDFDLLDVMGPMRVFGEAENELDLKINFIAASRKSIKSAQQVMVTPHYTLDKALKMDLFFMPCPRGLGVWPITENPAVMRQIKARVKHSTWTMSVCTGAGILARTGLMDGLRMTYVQDERLCEAPGFHVHVDSHAVFAVVHIFFSTNKLYFKAVVDYIGNTTAITWVKRARWVQDGKYVTSSGVSAGMDAALFVVSQLVNQTIADKSPMAWSILGIETQTTIPSPTCTLTRALE